MSVKEVVAAAADLEPLEVKLFDVPPRVSPFRPPFVGLTLVGLTPAGLMKADPLHSIIVKRTANRALLEEGFIIILFACLCSCKETTTAWGIQLP